MAKRMMKLTVEEVRANIPYDLICFARYGRAWDTGRLFRQAHDWTVGRGVPNEVTMTMKTFHLWRKLAEFCASI